jgi:putative transposase
MPQTRRLGTTFHTWRKKNGGMEVSDDKRLKTLLAESMIDVSTLREMLGMGAGERRAFE